MNLPTSASKKTKKDTCIFKYSYDGKRISMEKFLEYMEMNDANNAFIEWEYNVMNYPGITYHSWSWGLYECTFKGER